MSKSLSCLPHLLNCVEEVGSPRCQKEQVMSMAKQANAALAALGGFEETIKAGCLVQVRTWLTKPNRPSHVLLGLKIYTLLFDILIIHWQKKR